MNSLLYTPKTSPRPSTIGEEVFHFSFGEGAGDEVFGNNFILKSLL
jgi:hypothetical protein